MSLSHLKHAAGAAPADAWIRQFAALLQQQLSHYEKIHQLAEQQRQSIAAADTATLMQTLATKQEHIRVIEQLGAQLAPLRERWDREFDQLNPTARAPAQNVITRLRDVLGEIVALEDADRETLAATQTETATDLDRVQKGKAITKAYGTPKLPPIAHYKDDQA